MNGQTGTNDAFVVRMDNGGNIKWAVIIGGVANDVGYGAAFDNAGNIAVCGTYDTAPVLYNGTDTGLAAPMAGLTAGYLMKLSASGTLLFALSFTGSDVVTPQSVVFTPAGEPVVTGFYNLDHASFGYPDPGALVLSALLPTQTAFIVKASPSGTLRWGTSLGNTAGGALAYDTFSGALAPAPHLRLRQTTPRTRPSGVSLRAFSSWPLWPAPPTASTTAAARSRRPRRSARRSWMTTPAWR